MSETSKIPEASKIPDASKSGEPSWAELKPQLIKMALELGPLVIFYLGFSFGGRIIAAFPQFAAAGFDDPLYPATLLFMVAMVISLGLSWALMRRVAVMPMVTLVVVVVFGGLTFYFHDVNFAKMKPTVINALFGSVLLGGLLFGQSLLRYVFGEVYKLKPEGWTILTLRWGIFFFVLAALNEFVWRGAASYLPAKEASDLWVNFKVWGTMPLTIIFAMTQLPVLTKYALSSDEPAPLPPIDPTV
ncbi:septation protein A [soil metagenome]